jgi:hypothetical protein
MHAQGSVAHTAIIRPASVDVINRTDESDRSDRSLPYDGRMASGMKRSSVLCVECGAPGGVFLDGEGPLCDSCADARLSEITGYPRLPAPPPPEVIVGPDRRRHKIFYRIWRSPARIVVEAVESGDGGYLVKVGGSHFSDVPELVARARSSIRERIGRIELERSPHDGYWMMSGWEVNGRFEWNEQSELFDVVIDGRRLSWSEFGRVVSCYEGWEFKLSIDTEGLPEDVLVDDGATRKSDSDEVLAGAEVDTEPENEEDDSAPPLRHMDSSHWPPAAIVTPEREPRVH